MSKSVQVRVSRRAPTETERENYYALAYFSKNPQALKKGESVVIGKNGKVKIVVKRN